MAYDLLAVVDGTDTDDTLYPVPSGGDHPLPVTVPADGAVGHLVAQAVFVYRLNAAGSYEPAQAVPRDLLWRVIVTDARVIVYCEKFEKGGGFGGFGMAGFAVAQAANALSKARAARRNRGRLLVGQARYESLIRVGATARTTYGTHERVHLWINATPPGDDQRSLLLDIQLQRNVSALSVGHDIAKRAAAYRLQYDTTLDDDLRAHLSAGWSTAPGSTNDDFGLGPAHPVGTRFALGPEVR